MGQVKGPIGTRINFPAFPAVPSGPFRPRLPRLSCLPRLSFLSCRQPEVGSGPCGGTWAIIVGITGRHYYNTIMLQ